MEKLCTLSLYLCILQWNIVSFIISNNTILVSMQTFSNLRRTRKFLQQMTIINICSKLKTLYKLEKCPNFWNFWTLFVTLVSRGPSIIRLSKLIFPHKEMHYCFIYFGTNKLKCAGFSISELQHWALLPLHCTRFWE